MSVLLAACIALAIPDGDTLHAQCAHRAHVLALRVYQIDAPEFAHFGWKTQPYAQESRVALMELCPIGKPVVVRLIKYERRTARWDAQLTCGGKDVATYQVGNGWAWSYTAYLAKKSTMPALEAGARKVRAGLWEGPCQIPPWLWRKGGLSC